MEEKIEKNCNSADYNPDDRNDRKNYLSRF